MNKSVEPDVARDMLFALPADAGVEIITLSESLGRIIARDITAGFPVPPFDKSPFDGYAFRGEDTELATKEHPVVLRITEELPAGIEPTKEVTSGYAAKILTGAPIPQGANSTIKYEETEFDDEVVRISSPVKPGTNVVSAGSDIPEGAKVAACGDKITPPLMGMLASSGQAEVSVYRRPRAALINTGTELIELGQALRPAKIYNSNMYTLLGYFRSLGLDAYSAGVVPDDPDIITERITTELSHADIVVTTGGASVGDYDYLVRAAEQMGAEILFWKARIKPGGSVVAFTLDDKLVLSLSGNPGSAVMFLLRCALPYLKKLCGFKDCILEPIDVFLQQPFQKTSERNRLVRGNLEFIDGRACFVEFGAQGGGEMSSFASADLLMEIPANSPSLAEGSLVKAWRI